MKPKKRSLKVGIAVLVLCLSFSFIFPLLAIAEEFPSKPIKLIIDMPAGGSHDAHARAFCAVAHQYFGVPVLAVIKGGGGGSIGCNYVAQSKPDGYTLLFAAQEVIYNPLVHKLPFSYEDFVPIGRINYSSFYIVTHADAPWNNLKELVEDALEHPNKISSALDMAPGVDMLTIWPVVMQTGIKIKWIPIHGGGPQFKAFLSKDVDMGIFFASVVGEYIKEGKVKALAIGSPERSDAFPEVPTMMEQGYDHHFAMFRGVFAPKGISDSRLRKLREGFTQTIKDKSFQSIVRRMGEKLYYLSGEDFEKFLVEEVARIKITVNKILKEKK